MDIIDPRDFRKLDLNLLLVFHALMQERHVTRAATRLFLGQPAVSASLKRLRAAFDDPLFVRTSHGMAPTPRAHELARAIAPLLASVQDHLRRRPAFDPASSERTWRIGLSDSLEVALMPALLRRLADRAPSARVIAIDATRANASTLLDDGRIELAIGSLPPSPAWHCRRPLASWTFVCLYSPQQLPIRARRVTLAQYLRHPHLLTSFDASLRGHVDEQLEARGHARRVVFSSPHFATSPLVVRALPAFVTVPTFIAHVWRETLGLAVSPLPIDLPGHEVCATWRRADDADPGLVWLVDQLADVAREALG
ncbi:MAG: LysR family transcriptional regulator [Burkholderiales bacterium]|nr:LysR family transcriptional regulator [Burkholderiales bacterium]